MFDVKITHCGRRDYDLVHTVGIHFNDLENFREYCVANIGVATFGSTGEGLALDDNEKRGLTFTTLEFS
ncbi:MAG: hypothetical protein U0T83_00715 [Bacteriovoracaceae bacterium]